MNDSGDIVFDVFDDISVIKLNRPNKCNALTLGMIDSIAHKVEEENKALNKKEVCILAEGKHFCAGMDLKIVGKFDQQEADLYAQSLSNLFSALFFSAIPIAVFAGGSVLGGGVGLICSADKVYVDSHISISFPEVSKNIIPAVVSPYFINSVGNKLASYYFLTGAEINASKAIHFGLAHEISSGLTNDDFISAEIERLANLDRNTIYDAKKLINTYRKDRVVPENLVQILSGQLSA